MHFTNFLALGIAVVGSAQTVIQNVTLPCDTLNADCDSAVFSYLDSVCLPGDDLDMNAPCNQLGAIRNECAQGHYGFESVITPFNETIPDDDNSNIYLDALGQRDCVCQSQYFVANEGCIKCYLKHGGGNVDYFGEGEAVPTKTMSIFSLSYCAVTNTPTVAFETARGRLFDSANEYFSTGTVESTFSDSVGSKTAVSLYYTPSVTGSAAWVVPEASLTLTTPTTTAETSSTSSTAASSGTSTGTTTASGRNSTSATCECEGSTDTIAFGGKSNSTGTVVAFKSSSTGVAHASGRNPTGTAFEGNSTGILTACVCNSTSTVSNSTTSTSSSTASSCYSSGSSAEDWYECWQDSMVTVTPSVHASVRTSNGQIVATASANAAQSQETAAVAGVIALVGIVAWL